MEEKKREGAEGEPAFQVDEGAEPLLDPGEPPPWAVEYLPEGMKIPVGRKVAFLRFKSEWTDEPMKGVPSMWKEPVKLVPGEEGPRFRDVEHLSRILVCWTITDKEERLAMKIAGGDSYRGLHELAKFFIRACDGLRSDGGTGNFAKEPDSYFNPHKLWEDLGARCRQPIVNLYRKYHSLSEEQWDDFFRNGLVVAGVAG